LTSQPFVEPNHRRYRDADDALRRYVELRDRVGALKAQDVALGSGTEWEQRCEGPRRGGGTCGTTTYREIAGVERCTRCNRERRSWQVDTIGGGQRSSGVGIARRMHGRLAEVSLLATILNTRPAQLRADVWDLQRAAWVMRMRGRTEAAVAAALEHDLARLRLGTSGSTIARLVREVREEVEARLAKRGLLGG
jgi:hypothetical protein